LHQVVVGVVMDDKGHPVCSEMWPGNTADVTTLVPVARRLKERFGVDSVCIVADRGMVSDKNIKTLKDLGWRYIIGARMRSDGEVRDEVLGRAGRYSEVVGLGDEGGRSPLKVKEVMVEGERYVVCINEDQAKKDRFDREAIVAALEDQIKKGAKTLVGNRGYRKFLAVEGGRFSIDREKLKEEARFDGKWVLRTNMDLPSDEIALRYKQLNDVESAFRAMKSTLDTRPVFHQLTETIRGHVFCSFLALVLRKELLDLLAEQDKKQEWNDLIRDLSALMEMNATAADGKQFLIRNEARPAAKAAFAVCGVALPPVVRSATLA
jgi:transposase